MPYGSVSNEASGKAGFHRNTVFFPCTLCTAAPFLTPDSKLYVSQVYSRPKYCCCVTLIRVQPFPCSDLINRDNVCALMPSKVLQHFVKPSSFVGFASHVIFLALP